MWAIVVPVDSLLLDALYDLVTFSMMKLMHYRTYAHNAVLPVLTCCECVRYGGPQVGLGAAGVYAAQQYSPEGQRGAVISGRYE